MTQLLAVGAGGCVGAMARYWLSGVVQRQFGSVFPYGTLGVNVLGCLLLGWVMGLVEYRQLFSPHTRMFLTVGMLGGFTTFSTFGFETFTLLRDKEYAMAMGNVLASVIAGVIAVLAGWFAAKFLAA